VHEAEDLTTVMCRMSWKFGSLNLLEPSGSHRACYGTALAFSPLNAELNPICHLLALLGGATIVVVSRLRVNGCNKEGRQFIYC
jgi:hypothetical protein